MKNVLHFVCMSQPVGRHAGSFSLLYTKHVMRFTQVENYYLHILQISTFNKMIKNQSIRPHKHLESFDKNILQLSTKFCQEYRFDDTFLRILYL